MLHSLTSVSVGFIPSNRMTPTSLANSAPGVMDDCNSNFPHGPDHVTDRIHEEGLSTPSLSMKKYQ